MSLCVPVGDVRARCGVGCVAYARWSRPSWTRHGQTVSIAAALRVSLAQRIRQWSDESGVSVCPQCPDRDDYDGCAPPDVITMCMHFCHSAKITQNPIFSEACTRVMCDMMRARSAPPSPQTSPLASSRLIPVSCRGPVFFLSWLCSRADGCILLSGRLCSSAHVARVGRARILELL